ncbi:MAG: transglycosylase domain-containing protein [Flavobacteriaceae bacterium]|nr:transglycosylase domain-containing protein [Flavobacteriaceae bacterium]
MKLKNQNHIKKILKYIAVFISSIILSIGLLFLLVYIGIFGSLPDKKALSSISNEEASLVFSSDNILIGKFFAENRTNILWEEVPVHLKNALIATEDKRFYIHKGYDTQSYLRVLLKSLLFGNTSGGGGSTLTQQLVKNLYGRNDFGFLSIPVNKIKEIIIASRIEALYTKEELLLLYLNSVPFGENVYGVESASHRYFNKSASQLKIEESAVLVGLLKANTYFNPRLNPKNSLERRNMVLNLMEKEHYLSAEAADSLQKLPLKLNYENLDLKATAGYFVYRVKKKTLELLETVKTNTGKEYNLEKNGLKIYTTLNMQVQELASEAIKKQLTSMQQLLDKELENHQFKKQWYAKQKLQAQHKDLQKRKVEVLDWKGMQTKNISKLDSLWHYYKMLNAAVLITNPKNGAVISWVGGNHFRTLPFDMVLSHRQIASAFKPVLYATALENGFTPCTYLENEEKKYPEFENWEPKNFDHTSSPDSTVALWYALVHSMNLPTVDLYFKLGRENLFNTCNKLNFPLTADDAPSIALGTLDLSLYEIVKAYGAFANQGQTNELLMIDKITDAKGNILYMGDTPKPKEVFSIETSQLITAILQKAIDEGTGTKIRNQYGIEAALAGKTGTAQNYSDAWFIAYTPDLVLGTWVGASTPDVHFYSGNGSGSSLALPIVAQVLKGIEKDDVLRKRYLTSFALPDDIYSFMQCEPYRETGIEGFFNRLFNSGSKKGVDKDKKDKKKPVKKSFFEKLFKRNQ